MRSCAILWNPLESSAILDLQSSAIFFKPMQSSAIAILRSSIILCDPLKSSAILYIFVFLENFIVLTSEYTYIYICIHK